MIKFIQDVELFVVDHYDEKNDKAVGKLEPFVKGLQYDADIEDDKGESVNLQFADGSMVYNVPKNIFDIVT